MATGTTWLADGVHRVFLQMSLQKEGLRQNKCEGEGRKRTFDLLSMKLVFISRRGGSGRKWPWGPRVLEDNLSKFFSYRFCGWRESMRIGGYTVICHKSGMENISLEEHLGTRKMQKMLGGWRAPVFDRSADLVVKGAFHSDCEHLEPLLAFMSGHCKLW